MIYVNVRAIIEKRDRMELRLLYKKRVKSNESQTPYELPGGRLEKFESFIEGLKREVHEEAGLHITKVFGEETRIETKDTDANVEAIKPFAIYQTTNGPVDPLGAYFRCQASGNLSRVGDETEDIRWILVDELHHLLEKDVIHFSWVDRSGIMLLEMAFPEKSIN